MPALHQAIGVAVHEPRRRVLMSDNSKSKSHSGWLKGQSGNPAGRPRGRQNKATLAMEALLEDGSEQLISKAMSMAWQEIPPLCGSSWKESFRSGEIGCAT